ncbi:acetyltransferase [Flavobacterium aquidurense]|uniref:acetyltransferase n=1 Tax=Flavobacterium aquidurense TaxID=362413 RepID=UPI00091AFD11|nr:acetyltransferase [Flavobacterium aquidurense]OXA71478.1 acetyltransferase [Flavobacterium aquidurense]SHG95524.1 lipopolysaccharide O-acetyltransferase [Flavobacterium frigidimaris]
MFKRYGFFGSLKLLLSLIYTKCFFYQARLIRLPFDIRNKRFIKLGKNFTTGFGCRIEAYPQINNKDSQIILFGENVEINDYVHIAAGEKITIGNNVLIASKVFISDLNHGSYKGNQQDSPLTLPNDRKLSTEPIIIKDNVWIGEGVCIMAGVTIGVGCVIGASSVVTKSIPDYCIALGSPAKVIKQFDFDKKVWLFVN